MNKFIEFENKVYLIYFKNAISSFGIIMLTLMLQ